MELGAGGPVWYGEPLMNPALATSPGLPLRIVELRRYVTFPDARDVLIDIFDREFVETQEACGMVPLGHFRDLDDPNAFVWFRGFPRMEMRRDALDAFYTSPAWKANSKAANATMVDSDNVLLLRNARPDSGFDVLGLVRPAADASGSLATSFVAVAIFSLEEPADEEYLAAFERGTLPSVRACAQRLAYFVTEERPNDYPALPIRDGHWFVVAGTCAGESELAEWQRTFSDVPCEVLRLAPARRSLLR